MLPVLWRFDFHSPFMSVVLVLLAIGLVIYGGYAGWNGAESREAAPQRAALFAGVSAVVAYFGYGYAKGHGAPLHTYGLMIATAFIVAITLGSREARRSYTGAKTLADGTVVPMGDFMHEVIMDLSFYVLVGGLGGARILFIIVNWKEYAANPRDILSLSGGLVFYGGFIGAAAVVMWYARRHKLSLLRLGDIIIPCVSIGHAIGRMGCLSAGCCWGGFTDVVHPWLKHIALKFPGPNTPHTWAAHWDTSSLAFESQLQDHRLLDAATHQVVVWHEMLRYKPQVDAAGRFMGSWLDQMTGAVLHTLPAGTIEVASTAARLGHSLPVYPTQLMESLGEFLIFTILVVSRRTKRFHGQILATYLMLYSILRTTVEMFRGDEERGRIFNIGHAFISAIPNAPWTAWYNISISQFVSIAIFAAGVVVWAKYGRGTGDQSLPSSSLPAAA